MIGHCIAPLGALLLTLSLPGAPSGAATTTVTEVKVDAGANSLDRSAAASSPRAQVQWSEQSPAEAMEQAREEGRKVFVVFHATWCGPCKTLDREVFQTAEAAELLAESIALRLDVDDEANKAFARKHGARVLPTSLVLQGRSQVVGTITGFSGRDNYLKKLRGLLDVRRETPGEPSFSR